YWACISLIDQQVGRILAVLEAQGELDNTLIVWSSDHGEFLGDYNCFGKRSFLDAAANVPMLARYPERFPAGVVEKTPVSLIDLVPTFLGAAGADPGSADLDGRDMASVVGKGEKRTLYGELQVGRRGNYMAFDGDLKYIYSAGDQKEYLLDHRVDPLETRNCAANVMYAQEVKQMRSGLITYFQKEGYLDPLDGDAWKTYDKITEPDSPDAGLLIQDAGWAVPHYPIPGYSDDVKIRP
ncbi:MAG: sulfatase-like hydrolase/transferase, partial [bacterium]|nr:sulfatase-like hydrolase/transferase [bacterium]